MAASFGSGQPLQVVIFALVLREGKVADGFALFVYNLIPSRLVLDHYGMSIYRRTYLACHVFKRQDGIAIAIDTTPFVACILYGKEPTFA